MKNVEKSLEYVGFKPKEAKIYLALLELGEASATQIARRTNIKRTTIYNILPDLINQGVVTATPKNKRIVYFVEDPRTLKSRLHEKERAIDRILPDLMEIQRLLPYKPRITYYEGVGGMKDLYQDTLTSCKAGDTILSYTGLSNVYQYMPREYMRTYIDERIRRKIFIKIIAPRSQAAIEFDRAEKNELRDIRLVDNPSFAFSADTEIYANKVALISYKENFMGVIIESEEINQMQRMAFELMWAHLPAQ